MSTRTGVRTGTSATESLSRIQESIRDETERIHLLRAQVAVLRKANSSSSGIAPNGRKRRRAETVTTATTTRGASTTDYKNHDNHGVLRYPETIHLNNNSHAIKSSINHLNPDKTPNVASSTILGEDVEAALDDDSLTISSMRLNSDRNAKTSSSSLLNLLDLLGSQSTQSSSIDELIKENKWQDDVDAFRLMPLLSGICFTNVLVTHHHRQHTQYSSSSETKDKEKDIACTSSSAAAGCNRCSQFKFTGRVLESVGDLMFTALVEVEVTRIENKSEKPKGSSNVNNSMSMHNREEEARVTAFHLEFPSTQSSGRISTSSNNDSHQTFKTNNDDLKTDVFVGAQQQHLDEDCTGNNHQQHQYHQYNHELSQLINLAKTSCNVSHTFRNIVSYAKFDRKRRLALTQFTKVYGIHRLKHDAQYTVATIIDNVSGNSSKHNTAANNDVSKMCTFSGSTHNVAANEDVRKICIFSGSEAANRTTSATDVSTKPSPQMGHDIFRKPALMLILKWEWKFSMFGGDGRETLTLFNDEESNDKNDADILNQVLLNKNNDNEVQCTKHKQPITIEFKNRNSYIDNDSLRDLVSCVVGCDNALAVLLEATTTERKSPKENKS